MSSLQHRYHSLAASIHSLQEISFPVLNHRHAYGTLNTPHCTDPRTTHSFNSMGFQDWFAQKSRKWAALRQKPAMRLFIWSTWIPVAICFLDHAYFLGHISGNSMTPALNPDSNLGKRDIVLLQKFLIKQPGYLKVGDVVLLRNPMDPDKFLCKRILGVGGDEIVTRHPYPQRRALCPLTTCGSRATTSIRSTPTTSVQCHSVSCMASVPRCCGHLTVLELFLTEDERPGRKSWGMLMMLLRANCGERNEPWLEATSSIAILYHSETVYICI